MKDTFNNTWIQTYTGIQVWPLDPHPDQIDIRDIAHSLSMLCRFNGHCRQFYSVAEHSVHVSNIVSPVNRIWGLLHDAAEAYLSDIPKPVKQSLDQFHQLEERMLAVIANRFGLTTEIPEEVHDADMTMLATEKRVLMGSEPAPWSGLPDALEPTMICCYSPEEAMQSFLRRFSELTTLDG